NTSATRADGDAHAGLYSVSNSREFASNGSLDINRRSARELLPNQHHLRETICLHRESSQYTANARSNAKGKRGGAAAPPYRVHGVPVGRAALPRRLPRWADDAPISCWI